MMNGVKIISIFWFLEIIHLHYTLHDGGKHKIKQNNKKENRFDARKKNQKLNT
jgi:hypothetical protein